MLDVELHGMDPGAHHTTNVVFHVANTLLLFALLNRLTGSFWRSGMVAALFAVHPAHVESVAWVTERKDVLSTLFWLLTMWAYASYVRQPVTRRYILVLLLLGLGLTAKPMLVTLPAVLIVMDVWPLKRLAGRSSLLPLIREKVPLF